MSCPGRRSLGPPLIGIPRRNSAEPNAAGLALDAWLPLDHGGVPAVARRRMNGIALDAPHLRRTTLEAPTAMAAYFPPRTLDSDLAADAITRGVVLCSGTRNAAPPAADSTVLDPPERTAAITRHGNDDLLAALVLVSSGNDDLLAALALASGAAPHRATSGNRNGLGHVDRAASAVDTTADAPSAAAQATRMPRLVPSEPLVRRDVPGSASRNGISRLSGQTHTAPSCRDARDRGAVGRRMRGEGDVSRSAAPVRVFPTPTHSVVEQGVTNRA